MIVFKNYFKILKKFLPLIIMYIGICIGVTLLVNGVGSSETNQFSETKLNVAIFNNDDSVISKTFEKYISETSNIIEINQNKIDFEDAIFERKVDAIIVIPKNYYNNLKNNIDVKIDITSVPDSYHWKYVEMELNRFWTIVKTYSDLKMIDEKINELIMNDLKSDTSVKILNKDIDKLSQTNYYYNYINYGGLAILIYGIGTIMIVFNEQKIKKRTIISPKTSSSINRSLYFGNMCFSLIVWLIFVIISFILYGSTMLSSNGLLLILNSFIFFIAGLSISFLITTFINKKEAVSGMVNIIALGSSFISGAFVPQSALSEGVLNASKILPSYWYITNNNTITSLSNITLSSIKPIIGNMIIMIIFSIIFISLTLIINKIKLKNKNI